MSTGQDKFAIVAELTAEERVTGATRAAERKLLAVEKLGQRVGGSLTNALGSLDRRLLTVERLSRRAGGTITNALGSSFAVFSGGAFLAGTVRGFVGLNSQIEQAQVGLATLLAAQLRISGLGAMTLASAQLKNLRADAAAGIGELQDYMQGFQMILGPGLASGGSLDQLRELNRLAIAAGGAMRGQEGMQLAPIDLVQALSGQVSERVTPFVMQALSAIGMTAEKFRALKPEERIGALTKAFGAFSEGAKLMGGTWDAQFSTLKDRVKNLMLEVSKPLFDRWKEHLRAANLWLEKSQGSLSIIVDQWGSRLVALWDHLIKQAGTYAALVASAAVLPHAGAIGAAGGRAAAAGSAVMAGMRDPTGRARWIAQLRGESTAGLTTGIFAMTRTGLASLGKALVRVGGPIAIITTLFSALKGGLTEYPEAMAFLTETWGVLMMSLGQLGESFGLMSGKGSALNMIGYGLAKVLGGLVLIVSTLVKVLASLVTLFGTVFRVIGSGIKGAWAALKGEKNPWADLEDAFGDGWRQFKGTWTEWGVSSRAGDPRGPRGERGPGPYLREAEALKTAKPPQLNVGKMEVTIKTETMEDEARVMRTMKTVVGQLTRNRTQARRIVAASTG